MKKQKEKEKGQQMSPAMRNIIVVCVVCFGLKVSIDKFNQVNDEVKRWSVNGAVYKANTASQLSIAKDLPLISYKPLRANDSNALQQSNFSNDLFFSVPTSAMKKEVQNESVKKKPITQRINYARTLKENVRIDSISKNGAIINSRFIEVGSIIKNVTLPIDNGTRLVARLVKIDSIKDNVYISVKNKTYKLRLI